MLNNSNQLLDLKLQFYVLDVNKLGIKEMIEKLKIYDTKTIKYNNYKTENEFDEGDKYYLDCLLDFKLKLIEYRREIFRCGEAIIEYLERLKQEIINESNKCKEEDRKNINEIKEIIVKMKDTAYKERIKNKDYDLQRKIEEINKYSKDGENFETFIEIADLISYHYVQIEKWTQQEFSKIIYNSNDWREENSTFNTNVKDKDHLLFYIKDSQGNVFGMYLDSKIGGKLNKKSFLFSMKNDKQQTNRKYILKDDVEEEKGIELSQGKSSLFKIGTKHMILKIMKRQNSRYFHKNIKEWYECENELLTEMATDPFEIEKILVFQMK